MKRWLGILIGMFFIMIVIAGPNYAVENEGSATFHHYWINPDGSRGVFGGSATQQLNVLNSPSWVNPDGVRGPLRGTNVGRLALPNSDYWVNPDGFRGTVSGLMPDPSTYKIVTGK